MKVKKKKKVLNIFLFQAFHLFFKFDKVWGIVRTGSAREKKHAAWIKNGKYLVKISLHGHLREARVLFVVKQSPGMPDIYWETRTINTEYTSIYKNTKALEIVIQHFHHLWLLSLKIIWRMYIVLHHRSPETASRTTGTLSNVRPMLNKNQ